MPQWSPRGPAWSTAGLYIAPAAIVAVQLIVFPMPIGAMFSGLILGMLGALGAVGLALVWRSNRIVNFAQGDLGTFPATLAVLLITIVGLPWIVGVVAGLAAAAAVGLLADVLVVRRFYRAPRLQLTVATLGLAQLLAFGALLLPRAWGEGPAIRTMPAPFQFDFSVGQVAFDANDLIALVVAPLLIVAVAVLLRLTDTGTAVRAAADRSDRAASARHPGPPSRGAGVDVGGGARVRLGDPDRRRVQPALRPRCRPLDRAALDDGPRHRAHDALRGHLGHRRSLSACSRPASDGTPETRTSSRRSWRCSSS